MVSGDLREPGFSAGDRARTLAGASAPAGDSRRSAHVTVNPEKGVVTDDGTESDVPLDPQAVT